MQDRDDHRPPGGGESHDEGTSPQRSARLGRRLAAGVALLEAAVLTLSAGAALLGGLGDGSLPLAAAVALVAVGLAYLLVEVARGMARGRRWPTGVFTTVQLLVALVALSTGGRSVLSLAANPRIGLTTLAALLVSGVGLLAAYLVARSATDERGDPPVL